MNDCQRGAFAPPRNRNVDRIFLRELKTETIIGIFDWERKVKQTISIDLEMPADIARAARTDRIEDTLNYKAVAKRVQSYVEASSFQLVETLAENVARICLLEFDLEWVRVTLNKPGAIRNSRDVGVMIERHRHDLDPDPAP
jgi:dihydroneopterin aldolase